MLMQELGNKGLMEYCCNRPKRLLLNAILFAVVCFFLMVLGKCALADEWPMLFHDPGQTCASADTKVKPPFRMLWRYAVEDDFGAHGNHGHKPIVADGIVYISGVFHEKTPQKAKSMLLSLDALKGTPVWSKEGNFSIPAVSHGTLHTVQWKETGKDAVDCQAIALQAKTGEVQWQVKMTGTIGAGPYVAVQEDLLFITGYRDIVALDRKTGKQLWEWSYKGDVPKGYGSTGITIPVIDENGVYFIDAQRNVNCLDPKSGKLKWKKENFIRRQFLFPTVCSAAVADGILVIREGGWIGGDPTARQGYKIYALSTKDGSILWRRGVLCGGMHPILAKNVFYMFGSFGEMLALDARTGAYLWDRSQITGNGRACGMLIYANGVLYFYTGHGGGLRHCVLLCVDAGSGEMLWTSCDRGGLGHAPEWFWEAACAGPSFANGIVYLATRWGGIFALAPDEGQPE